MAFFEILKSTTAYADDTNDNFYHLAQGTIEPKANTGTMGLTSSIYDLGASITAWKTLYCNNIYANTSTLNDRIWKQIVHVTVTSAANLITISGLNGDISNEYYIICNLYVTAQAAIGSLSNYEPYFYFNNALSYTVSEWAGLTYESSSVSGIFRNYDTVFPLFGHYMGTANLVKAGGMVDIHIMAGTGAPRYLHFRSGGHVPGSLSATDMKSILYVWPYLTPTITAMYFDASVTPQILWAGGDITIYEKVGI